ncbi:hypothetical protein B0H13DRAFT_2675379 [Mycena leptocephala]|nr:hypothetical protein B0H13DRAFT_2675379 [Mycena leptocephala]
MGFSIPQCRTVIRGYRKYLCDEFARIHREHRDTMAAIPVPWPSSDILDSLVQKSSGYFIYASTVIKFIDEKYSRPTERLAAIQNRTPTDSDAPFGALDQVYTEILSRVPAQYRSKLCDTLQCAILFDFGIKLPEIERLFEFQPGEVQSILRGLESLLEYTPTGHISVYHASFLDFLQDPQRSSSFFIGQEQRMNVARAVLKQLSDDNYWRESIDNPLTRRFTSRDLISCLASVPPSAELLPLVRRVDKDILWPDHSVPETEQEINQVLAWLEAVEPVPEDLIRRWEGYRSSLSSTAST